MVYLRIVSTCFVMWKLNFLRFPAVGGKVGRGAEVVHERLLFICSGTGAIVKVDFPSVPSLLMMGLGR